MPRLTAVPSTWTTPLAARTRTRRVAVTVPRPVPRASVTLPAPRATLCSLATCPSAPLRMPSVTSSVSRVPFWVSVCPPTPTMAAPRASATSSSHPSTRLALPTPSSRVLTLRAVPSAWTSALPVLLVRVVVVALAAAAAVVVASAAAVEAVVVVADLALAVEARAASTRLVAASLSSRARRLPSKRRAWLPLL